MSVVEKRSKIISTGFWQTFRCLIHPDQDLRPEGQTVAEFSGSSMSEFN
jgi:hypothetical protein